MAKKMGSFGGKKAAPFKAGGRRDTTNKNTAKGMPRKGNKRGGY